MSASRIVTRGLVLRATETKEADYILTVLTAERGKIAVIARGARRRGSKIAAASQLLVFSELVLYERKGWYYLDEASTVEQFTALRADLELLALGSYFAEMTETVAPEDTAAPELLSLLLNALYALDTLHKPQALVRAAFELRLLAHAGYEPLLDGCAVCGAENPQQPHFDLQEGVVLCRKCAGINAGLAIDSGSLAAMRHIVSAPMKKLLSFTLDAAPQERLSAACELFTVAQLERKFKTLDFYKSIKLT